MKKDSKVQMPDMFNSKTAKILLGLPGYSYTHSSSAEDNADTLFLGREKLFKRLRDFIVSPSSKTGVYLIAGNRGIGKTSLINKVISETSLPKNKSRIYSTFFIVGFFLVLVLQYCTNQNINVFNVPQYYMNVFLGLIGLTCFIFIGDSSYLRKKTRTYENNYIKRPIYTIIAAIKEIVFTLNSSNRTQNVVKFVFILIVCHFLTTYISCVTYLVAFLSYLCAVLVCRASRFMYHKYKEMEFEYKRNYEENVSITTALRWLKEIVLEYIKSLASNNINNCHRVYLKINFGHDVLKERDILRLIARTLSTEYKNFRRSLRHMWCWWVFSLAVIFSVSFLFYDAIYKSYLDESINSYFREKTRQNNSFIQIDKETTVATWVTDSTIKTIETRKDIEIIDPLIKTIAKIGHFISIDSAINKFWFYVSNAPAYFLLNAPPQERQPISYAFWLIFLMFCLLGKLLLLTVARLTPIKTHNSIKKQLRELNESITHYIEREVGIGANNGKTFNVNVSKKKSRLIADEREIEKELQDILEDVQKIPAVMARPEFVLIFDELDKVSSELLNNSETTVQDGKIKETMFVSNSSRDRQAIILKLLANMKYFLSTAKAKFIFIAGHEMYDMYLADIADRNNYFGSIFNDVILVPSWFSDTDKKYDVTASIYNTDERYNITALTEVFVCQRLIPKECWVGEFNLKRYQQYLENDIYNISKIKNEQEKRETTRKIWKIIATLQHFIIYLSHTSKGAPKKMLQVFESFIINSKPDDFDDKGSIVQNYHNTSYFLYFNYYKQFTLGITSYLISPVIHCLATANIQQHSDKLLISTLRLVDYMLKFHSQNFTWRQLDISPEVVEANHPLELKAIINDVVTLYEQTHLSKPIISLFDYKFDNLLSQEISFISKLDESFSAQFSFSLDESLALKQYLGNLLREKQHEYEKSRRYGKTLISSISSLQILLGDLYFLDDELEEAAVYYKDGMQLLEKKLPQDSDENPSLDPYRLIRNQLKLAYLYEKRKQPEFAYLLYDKVTQYLKKVHSEKVIFQGLQLFCLPLLAKLQILEKQSCEGILDRDIRQIDEDFKYLTRNIVKHNDIKIIAAEFYSKLGDILYYKNDDLIKNNNDNGEKENSSIKISYYPFMYYKRAFIILILDENEQEEEFQSKTLLQILNSKNKASDIYKKASAKYCATMARVLSDLGDVSFSEKEKYNSEDTSIVFWNNWPEYVKSKIGLKEFLEKLNVDTLNKIETTLFLYSLSIKFYRKAGMHKQAAFQITKILNVFKFCSKPEIDIHRNEICNIVNIKIADSGENKTILQYMTNKTIKLLYMANDSLDIFEILKRKKDFNDEASLQYIQVDNEIIKVVALQKELELYLLIGDKSDILAKLYDQYIISPYCINYSISARVHQLRLKARLNWETYEIIKSRSSKYKNIYYEILSILITNDNNWENGKMRKIFSGRNEIKELEGKKKKILALLELLISDSIFCYTKILRLIKTSNDSYIFNHKFFAEIYRKLAKWTEMYETFRHIKDYNCGNYNSSKLNSTIKNAMDELKISNEAMEDIKKHLTYNNINPKEKSCVKKRDIMIDKYLEKQLGRDFKEHVSSRYYYQSALLHYHKSIETHTRGRAYFNLSEQLYFIKGDYDDVQSHFNVAEERFMINRTKCYKKYLDKIKNAEKRSSLYKVDNYLEKKQQQ